MSGLREGYKKPYRQQAGCIISLLSAHLEKAAKNLTASKPVVLLVLLSMVVKGAEDLPMLSKTNNTTGLLAVRKECH